MKRLSILLALWQVTVLGFSLSPNVKTYLMCVEDLANLHTPGYYSNFSDAFYGATVEARPGSGNLALLGPGFFKFTGSSTYYSRNGVVHFDQFNRLVNVAGDELELECPVPCWIDARRLSLTAQGEIVYQGRDQVAGVVSRITVYLNGPHLSKSGVKFWGDFWPIFGGYAVAAGAVEISNVNYYAAYTRALAALDSLRPEIGEAEYQRLQRNFFVLNDFMKRSLWQGDAPDNAFRRDNAAEFKYVSDLCALRL